MASKIKVDTLETANGSGTIALSNQLSGMTTASLPALGSAQMPTGSVLQVVHGSTTTMVISTTQNSFVGSGCTATITPTSTSSKILIIGNLAINCDQSSGSDNQANTGIKRGSTVISGVIGYDELRSYIAGTSANIHGSRVPCNFLDSPSTTSATTYELIGSLRLGSRINMQMNLQPSTITLMEIQG